MNGDINRSLGTSVVCYFCNSPFGSAGYLQHHIKQCGSILEKCTNGCGSWIERKDMTRHTRQCKKMDPAQRYTMTDTLPSRASLGSHIYSTIDFTEPVNKTSTENFDYLKRELDSMKMALQKEQERNNALRNEIEHMKRQYGLSEERNHILVSTMTALRRSNEEEFAKQAIVMSELREDINFSKATCLECKEHFAQLDLHLLNLRQIVELEQNQRSQLELVLNNQDGKLRNITKIEADLNDIRSGKNQEFLMKNEQIFSVQRELLDLKTIFMQENMTLKQQIKELEASQTESSSKAKSIADLMPKMEKFDFEIKNLKNIVEEDSSTLGMMDKNMSALSKTVSHLQESGHFSEVNHDVCSITPTIVNKTGHLVWRIDCYQQKLKDAIDNGTVLHSPAFLSSNYGYTLQAELNLNGIGKWKGRHITASVFIVPGEYDSILKWPATLQADIILKDQTPKRDQSNDIVKTLTVKRKESLDNVSKSSLDLRRNDKTKSVESLSNLDQNSPNIGLKRQYIFIPHTNLDKFDYTKNNVMFIEILVSEA